MRITVSGIPPFVANESLEYELCRFGKFASCFKTVSLGCKEPKLMHVQSGPTLGIGHIGRCLVRNLLERGTPNALFLGKNI